MTPRAHPQGRWKSMTPRAHSRSAWEYLQDADRTMARHIKAGAGTVRLHRLLAADLVIDGEHDAIQHILKDAKHNHAVFNLMFDSTSLDLKVGDEAPASHEALNIHAVLTWTDHAGNRHQDEVVVEPVAIPDTSAHTYLAALRCRLPYLGAVLRHASLSCLVLTVDSSRANIKAAHHMFDEQLSDPCQLGMLCKCSQHQAALVLQPVTRGLGIVSGLFCC
eukprot:8321404-Alexandrium_andersonii.AAC.1